MLGLALGICASADVGSVCNPICALTFYDVCNVLLVSVRKAVTRIYFWTVLEA